MIRKIFLLLPIFTLIGIVLWYFFVYDDSFKRLWISADKEAQKLEKKGDKETALRTYKNKLSIGAIYYRDAKFKEALEVYESTNSKEAFFNRGNSLVMLGKYKEAIDNYKLVLKIEPTNIKAKENILLAKSRQDELDKFKNTSAGATEIGADKVVYDNKSKKGDDYQENEATKGSSNQQWLDRLETSPREFLRSKFTYQYTRDRETKND